MVTYEDFTRILNEEVASLPDYVHDGTYSVDPVFGKQIVLYYGSFAVTLGNAGEQVYRTRIRETVRHEFLHHLETLAGLNKKGSLVEEDARRMQEYYKLHSSS